MITLLLVSIITAVYYLLWKKERHSDPTDRKTPSWKVPFWLLLGILSVAALLSPKIRGQIKDLRQKYHL